MLVLRGVDGPGSIRINFGGSQSNRSCTEGTKMPWPENGMKRCLRIGGGFEEIDVLNVFVERLKTKTTLLIIGNFGAHLVGNNKLSANLFNTRWWQLKYFLFSPRIPGEIRANLTCAYFSNGLKLNHQLDLLKVLFCYFC